MTNEATDNVTWVCPDCQSVTVDPADVTALQAAHDALKDENKRLTELLRGDRMIVATRINHEYTKAKGVIRELQTENERLRAILENTRQQRDIAYSERAEAQRWQQLIANEQHIQEDKTVLIENQGQWVGIKRGDVVFGVWLDELGCAIFRKVQP